jgi:hypothetical protein
VHSCSAHDRNSQSSSAPSRHCRVLKLSTPADTLVYKLRPAEQSRSATAWTIDDVPGVVEAKRGATGGGGFVRPASPPLPACDKGATRREQEEEILRRGYSHVHNVEVVGELYAGSCTRYSQY